MENTVFNFPFTELSQVEDDELLRKTLGPLYNLLGTWVNDDRSNDFPAGWNIIGVPAEGDASPDYPYAVGDAGFLVETIPYTETLSFTPISLTLNHGLFNPNERKQEQVQKIGAVLYEQTIESEGLRGLNPKYAIGDTDTKEAHKIHDREKAKLAEFFKNRGFEAGKTIHKELGILLYMHNFDNEGDPATRENLQIARMGNIPHGNSILCLGSSKRNVGAPDFKFLAQRNYFPSNVDERQPSPRAGYGGITYAENPPANKFSLPFWCKVHPMFPNETMEKINKGLKFKSNIHFSLTTKTKNGSGGILSVPFLDGAFARPRMETTDMDCDYWLSEMEDKSFRLQYFQDISIVFPIAPRWDVPIIWPHIGMNSLKRKV